MRDRGAAERAGGRAERSQRNAAITIPRRRSRHVWWTMLVLLLALLAAASELAARPHAPGGADQLGGQLDAHGNSVSFRVHSAAATRIEVYLYRQPYNAPHVRRYRLQRTSRDPTVWQVSVPVASLRAAGFSIEPADPDKLFTDIWYGYRAWGPNWPHAPGWVPGSARGYIADVDTAGNRFNPNKLLLDPYALEASHDHLSGAVRPALTDAALYASGGPSTLPGRPDRNRDSGRRAPKGVVAMPFGRGFASLDTGAAPERPVRDDIVYEAHLRGLTRGDASIGRCRGTYAGAAAKIPHLQQLGVTAIELMPMHETDNEANDVEHPASGRSAGSSRGDNYWGYMSASFFAPDRRYACDQRIGGPTRELAQMVRAFHAAGIKVIADVVYNHTAEGGTWSSTDPSKASLWSLRGLDNASYYLLTREPGSARDRAWYYDITGTGNTTNARHPRMRNLIVDSLLYQKRVLGIDGFRFDLGIALANRYDNETDPDDRQRYWYDRADPGTALAHIVAALPGVHLASEPWGLAPGGQGYQLGRMPAGFSEWNGGWRDVIRRTLNRYGAADAGATRALIASRVAGSPDLFDDPGDGRHRPWYSVNFLNVHDGYTLKDVFSCNGQNTGQPWPLGPSDGGSAEEDQWDNGGDAVRQRQQARTGFALLMLSAGVPIFNAGDEFLRSLNCNNNSYNVDSAATWLDWNLGVEQREFLRFASRMIAFRQAQPALRPDRYPSGADGNANRMGALDWFGADKRFRTGSDDATFWHATQAQTDGIGHDRTLAWRHDSSESGGSAPLLVLFNGEPRERNFTLPWPGPDHATWCRITDTAAWAEGPDQVDLDAATCIGGEDAKYWVHGRSVVVMVGR